MFRVCVLPRLTLRIKHLKDSLFDIKKIHFKDNTLKFRVNKL